MWSLILMVLILTSCHEKKKQPDVKKVAVVPTCHTVPGRFSSSTMLEIKSRQFIMGTNAKDSYPAERPAHPVKVSSFWIDTTEVTNQDFLEFVKATKYKTVAERKPDWSELKKQLPPDVPKPDSKSLVPASLVFTPPSGEVNLNQMSWWKWVPGASWKAPSGPGSDIKKILNHPVVHIALTDAAAYCRWKKKRLPTEAEWELAARGGVENKTYAWGDEFKPSGKFMANTYQGKFPTNNLKQDGFVSTSPVKSFSPNGYGLFDMIGNVWEWTSDFYDESFYENFKNQKVTMNPRGAAKSRDPNEPYAIKHVIKGGSYLCADNYCVNYRPSARLGAAYDSGASHIGFRCVQ